MKHAGSKTNYFIQTHNTPLKFPPFFSNILSSFYCKKHSHQSYSNNNTKSHFSPPLNIHIPTLCGNKSSALL